MTVLRGVKPTDNDKHQTTTKVKQKGFTLQ